jgi:hypothetical protein
MSGGESTNMKEQNSADILTEHFSRSDRDLLVTMHEQIKGIKVDIRDLKDGTSAKISDHELRLRRLELWGGIAIGASYGLQFYFNYLK